MKKSNESLYLRKEKIKVNVIFNTTDQVQGHSGIVHGGL